MSRRFVFYLSLLAALSYPHVAAADRFVQGTITTTTWENAYSPYRVTGTVTVPSGNTLTIEPGVDVLFDADVQFVVQGRLHAVGTPADSVRFFKGVATEWGGIRITGRDSSTVHYARISDGNADGSNRGGGMYVAGMGTRLELAHSMLTGNRASQAGGGVFSFDTAMVALEECTIAGNTSGTGGGVANWKSATAKLTRCLIASNGGGGVENSMAASMVLTGCTVAANTGGDAGGITNTASAVLRNCIVWGNSLEQVFSYPAMAVTYSDIQGGYAGTGNIGADPLFVEPANGDFRLSEGSPCIDSGDPASPLDPDATRADMGAFYFPHEPYGTPVSGTITTTTWTQGNSPYRVAGTTTVPAGNRLTIEPGVNVVFEADAQFVVQGSLHAMGIATDSVRFVEGTAPEWGGIRISGGDSSVLRFARISGANADGSSFPDFAGGGMHIGGRGTTVDLAHCAIVHNRASYGGGLYCSDHASTTLVSCALVGNTASAIGGGVFNSDSAIATLTNCTVVSNAAVQGGGVYNSSFATVNLVNCIIWANVPAEQTSVAGGEAAATYSDVQQPSGVYPGQGNINADPLFSTHPDSAHQLTGSSPCIDAGDPNSPPDPDASRADMGTFYVGEPPLAVVNAPRPLTFGLSQNLPNPFNPATTIRFSLPGAGPVALSIYDVNGRLARTLVDGTLPAGQHEVVWDGADRSGRRVASGLYLYRLTSGEGTVTKRMVLVR